MRVGLIDKFKKCFDWCSRSLVSLQQDWTTYGLTAIQLSTANVLENARKRASLLSFPSDAIIPQVYTKHVWNPGTVLGAGHAAGNKTDRTPCPHQLPLRLGAWSTLLMTQALQQAVGL